MSSTNPKQNKGGTQRVGGQKTGSRGRCLREEEQLRGAGRTGSTGVPEASPRAGDKRGGEAGAAWTCPVPAASFQPRGLALPNLGCETEGCGDY